jgi:hypothetical protein
MGLSSDMGVPPPCWYLALANVAEFGCGHGRANVKRHRATNRALECLLPVGRGKLRESWCWLQGEEE